MAENILSSASPSKVSPGKRPNTHSQSSLSDANKKKSVTRIVAPQLKIVDGQVVLDESLSHDNPTEDLTAGMTVVQEDPNRYFTSATYSARRKAGINRWTLKQTDLFYEALSMCGTDFSMIATLFPHRTRNQIKAKYKAEEKSASHRVSAALVTKKRLDASDFAKKLARALGNGNKG